MDVGHISTLRKALATDSTATSFSALIPTGTAPPFGATRAIIDVPLGGQENRTLCVIPYGGNTNDDVINVKVSGWARIPKATGGPGDMWISHFICEVQATLSSSLLGLASYPVPATQFLPDDLTLTAGIAILHQNTANVDVAWFECDVGGFEKVELTFDLGSGGDAQNALVRFDK